MKIACVSPINKEGCKLDCGNYRPISVISVIANIYEKLVYEQLSCFVEQQEIITCQQSGFRKKRSTETDLIHSSSQWLVNMDNGLVNGFLSVVP